MGLIDPILNYSKIKAYQSRLIKKFISNDIDLFIGIDSPDFNIGIHKALKNRKASLLLMLFVHQYGLGDQEE